MELTTAARRFLLAQAAVTGYVQQRVWKDRLEDVLDGTGQRAIVLKDAGSWSLPQARNTQEYPLLRVEFWADHTRNEDGTIDVEDGMAGARALYRVVDPLIHGVRDVRWGGDDGLFVIGCQRYSEPLPMTGSELATGRPQPTDADAYEAQAVAVLYAVQTIH